MFLQGKNLFLRDLQFNDLEKRVSWLSDPKITHFFTNLATSPITITSMQEWYQKASKNTNHELHFAIITNDGNHIGGSQLKEIDWRNRSAEFGIFIGEKNEWGKGYGTEATKLLIKFGFMSLNLHRIWLRVDADNLAAQKCYEKVGFIKEGIFRDEVYREGNYHDSVVMSILKYEYNPNF